MALVLCTGIDVALLQTRKLILEQVGHTVFTAVNQPEIAELCTEHSFDVAVIGQTVSHRMKRVIASLILEKCSSVKILELYPPHQGKALDDADAWLQVPVDIPPELEQRVAELAGKQGKGRSEA